MPYREISGGVTAPRGFLAGSTYCGIKSGGRDLTVLAAESACVAAAVFTKNKVQAAPIAVNRRHLAATGGHARAVVVNSGNANACTGRQGEVDAEEMARLAAEKIGCRPEEVLVASTGVIGVAMPMEKVRAGLQQVSLSKEAGHDAALGIMTTDTRAKEISLLVEAGGVELRFGGIAKGSGMIHPNMGTMLAFVTTDAAVEPAFLAAALQRSVDRSFNMISVDGDTSTNDTLIVLANGRAGNSPIAETAPLAAAFQEALDRVTMHLAREVARDGEGASKLIEVRVRGARNAEDARLAARAVAASSLVKAAVYGADPNWGRILCAAGYSGADVDGAVADVSVGEVQLMQRGDILKFDHEAASRALRHPEVHIDVNLNLGEGEALAWGCDLTEQYVKINAEYTT
ncbi:MAG: bifunctional glutamate N-acetyltransferase/amino-acid acetyltransferase ArgJ [Dehalococcoidales bacterium]|nr:bifunctional glutamate N-acetyltransferase/amino-acid acetyltransferase ArgJ [Dehalococcoidales bacterium]